MQQWIFFLACFCALGSICAVGMIRPNEIDHRIARGGQSKVNKGPSLSEQGCGLNIRAVPLVDLFNRKDLVVFLTSVILFHFGNAAMLPMAGQVLAKTHPGTDIGAIGACIIDGDRIPGGLSDQAGAIRKD
jgi:hypothetical protein